MGEYNPKIICFACKFGWGYLEGETVKKMKGVVPILCSGKIDITHIVNAYAKGADGVLILACDEGNCHFHIGNFQARKRVMLLKKTLKEFGIESERLQIILNSDPLGASIPGLMKQMAEKIKKLGKLSAGKEPAPALKHHQ
jgi:F420-non-reducing hydrogenase iron-sulfur subunit